MHSTVTATRGASEIVEIGRKRKRSCDCDDTNEARDGGSDAYDRCTAMPSMYQKYPASSSRQGSMSSTDQ